MMMTATDFMKFQSDAIKATNAMAAKSIEGMQKLADLNMKTVKASMEASSEQVKSMMAVKDVKGMNDMFAAVAQPSADHVTAYAKDVYAISSTTGAEMAAMLEQQVEEGNKQMFAAVDALAKNAPAGTEGVVSFMKQSLTAAKGAYEQANKASKQAADVVEANFASATKAATAKKR